ncbi:hypothetical protein OU798_07995 [Prolixibacteraceae bacterium Z1-6]|uniref:Uncharacterized protein n=1 Tax=Draconibacterium aestuarii TaxID=2998507 RepID=A0A9X3F7M3_9BACT|nr:hypothetical protein [Prolixibacteraceae bacterium Z1-6]
MRSILSLTGILALIVVLTSAISIHQTPQDPPRGKKEKKHIKMVKVDDNGKKMEIDTVMNVDEVLVWNGDTIDGGKALKWVSEEDFDMDFDFDIENDGEGNVFILRSGKGRAPMAHEYKIEGDSAKKYRIKVISDGDPGDFDVLKWKSIGDDDVFLGAPQGAHKMMFFGDRKKGNVIDLSDPGIISFEKKELKNGKEKIIIIREKPLDKDVELNEEIIIKGAGNAPMIFGEGMPHKSKQIKVIAGDDGKVEILEDGKVWSVEKGDEDTKVIEKDGKKIIIKKRKEGGEMKVDVEVEEEIKEQ